MEWLPKILGFISSGVSSNWWGIACPSHCFGFGFPAVILSLSLGLALGFILGCITTAWIFGLLPLSSPGRPPVDLPAPAFDRVRAYLVDEQRAQLARQRRNH